MPNSPKSIKPLSQPYLWPVSAQKYSVPPNTAERIRVILRDYEKLNRDYADLTEKKLLPLLQQLDDLIAKEGIPAEVDRELADVLRDEYAIKHFAVDALTKKLLDQTAYGQRIRQTLANIETGEFLDGLIDSQFLAVLTPAEYQHYAGADGVFSYVEAVAAKKELQVLQFILPVKVQQASGKEFVYLRPGDLLFTGKARKRDDVNVFPNAYFWGGLFGLLGMERMHVGAYLGQGSIIESGKDEEGQGSKKPGWQGVTTEDIYDSVFSSAILNGVTSVGAAADTRNILTRQLLNEEGVDYDFAHALRNKNVDCAELIVLAYQNQGVLPAKLEPKPDPLFKATRDLLK